MINIIEGIVAIYVLGAGAFVSYNVLELSSLQRQNDATRDKNVKNAIVSQVKQIVGDIRGTWKWPVVVVKASMSAIKWVKTL
jgi:predicted small secreted protein